VNSALGIATPVSCKQLKCAALDGTCSSDSVSTTVCLARQYCSNGVCTDYLKQDYVCEYGGPLNQCGASLSCQLNSANVSVCLPVIYQANPGEACSTNAQCYYKNTTTQTTSSTCVNGKCYGKMEKEQCDNNFGQCVKGLFCSPAGKCAELLSDGQNCSSPFECASGSCIPQAVDSSYRLCTRFQSVSEGGACASTQDCTDGLTCLSATAGNKWGVCILSVASSNKACTTNSNCSYPETCVCSAHIGLSQCVAPSSRPVGLVTAELASFNCSLRNNCLNSNSSCMLANCATELCSYFSILFGPSVWTDDIVNLQCIYGELATSAYTTCYGDSLADQIVGSEHSDALLLLPAFVVVALMFIVIMAM